MYIGTITSKDNRLIKETAKLAAERSFREEMGLFVTEGLRLCRDIVWSTQSAVRLLFTQTAWEKNREELRAMAERCPESACIADSLSGRLADTQTPQGVFCVCKKLDNPGLLDKMGKNGKFLILESLRDPGNLGAILRSAEAFGMDQVILSQDSVDLYSPKVVRASMGAFFRVPVCVHPELSEVLAACRSQGVKTYAACLSPDSVDIRQCSLRGCVACVVGNEASGLREATAAACAGRVVIPMAGQVESLNASVAASILMWEMQRAGREET